MTSVSLPVPSAIDDPLEFRRFTRTAAGDGGEVAESSFQLGGLHCAACAGIIETALQAVPGVIDAQVNASAARAQVRWLPGQTRPSAMVAAVVAAGYEAVPDTAAGARALRRTEGRKLLWRLFVAMFCAMQVMMLATPSYVAGANELAPDLAALLNRAEWLLTLPVLFFSAGPFFRSAWLSLKQGRIGMDVPVSLGIAVAFVASSGAAFDPHGPFGRELYFDSLTMFVSFLLLGRFVEMKVRHRSADALERAMAALPQSARRLNADGSIDTVSLHRLAAGDIVQVAVGEAFPADGHLLDADTAVDESLLSGESRPVQRHVGDEVIAASVNVGAPVRVRVERVGADTRHEAIVALMREALSRRPAATRLADRWAGPFLWVVLLLAAGAGLVWHAIDPGRAFGVAAAVLIVTCPCALSLATPAALVSAAGGLARRGVLLRRVEALEALAGADTVFLDKTGTLTATRPALAATQPLAAAASWPAGALQDAAASLAAQSQHPLAAAIASTAHGAGAWPWHRIHEHPGLGLEALDAQGRAWRLGSAAWVGAPNAVNANRIQVFFGLAQQPLLRFDFDEALAPDSAAAVQALQSANLDVTLLSGDAPERVQALAGRLGIAHAIGAATPEMKLRTIREAQARGKRVVMVGDGVNDAPVLAQADVSFAMAQGAAVSRVHADAVVLSNRLGDVVQARLLARRTLQVIRQNLVWGAAYNLACVPLAVAGRLPPWAAGLGMALSSLVVVSNALRLALAPRPEA